MCNAKKKAEEVVVEEWKRVEAFEVYYPMSGVQPSLGKEFDFDFDSDSGGD